MYITQRYDNGYRIKYMYSVFAFCRQSVGKCLNHYIGLCHYFTTELSIYPTFHLAVGFVFLCCQSVGVVLSFWCVFKLSFGCDAND